MYIAVFILPARHRELEETIEPPKKAVKDVNPVVALSELTAYVCQRKMNPLAKNASQRKAQAPVSH